MAFVGKRIRKVLAWGTILILAILVGGVAGAYCYVTESDTLAAVIKEKAGKILPRSMVGIVRVTLRPLVGDTTLHHVSVQHRVDGQVFSTLQAPWLRVKHDLWAAFHGQFVPTEVIVAQPTLRVKRRRDGTWNLEGLLADPMPGPSLTARPVVMVKGGIVELFSKDDGGSPAKVLRDVAITIEPRNAADWHFEGSAQGDSFDRLALEGDLEGASGRILFTKGELTHLVISQTLMRRLPPEIREPILSYGPSSGEVDVSLKKLVFDPSAKKRWSHELGLELRDATWACEKLPFPLNNVEASGTVREGVVAIQHVSGANGKTRIVANGAFNALDFAKGALNLDVSIFNLELDRRLRNKTPQRLDKLWDDFKPRGWVNAQVHLARASGEENPRWGITVDCRDVGMTYHLFRYPIEHAHGFIDWAPTRVDIDMETVVGNKPFTAKGTIRDPGPTAVVDLDFTVENIPVDETLLTAMPPLTQAVVRQFHPTGWARGSAHLHRTSPIVDPGLDGRGKINLSVELDLNDGCGMKWVGLPYQVSNLTGHLSIKPDQWTFTDMRGENGTSRISGHGRVDQVRPGQFAVDLDLTADNLAFDSQLRTALPKEWRATWATLNPSGASRVDAKILVAPGKKESYHLVIVPKPETRLQIELTPAPGTPVTEPAPTIKLPPMEDIEGKFVFDNGTVAMEDVKFSFHEAPVRFRSGVVTLKANTGAFDLKVKDLEVSNLRLDADLRRVMPPLMREFSRRLDDGRTFYAHADLGIAWLGQPGQPAFVNWNNARVVFNGNTIQVGLPIGQIHGQAEDVSGWSDGRELRVQGNLNLLSIDVAGQQVTNVTTPVKVGDGWARFSSIRGDLLSGKLYGSVNISLDATPKYEANVRLQKADLAEYTKTLPGRQELRGFVSAEGTFGGQGSDLHTLSGSGKASIEDGDLGKLPWAVRLLKVPNLAGLSKTAFDSAFVAFTMQDGLATLKPITLTGDAISLKGSGTLDPLGDLDVHLNVGYGRDDGPRIPILTNLAREAGGGLVAIQLKGPVASPRPKPEFLPIVIRGAASLKERFDERRGRIVK
jgi:AsmA-like C-terminal region